MRSFLPSGWRRRAATVSTAVALALGALTATGSPAHADPAIPTLTDGQGLTQVAGPANPAATPYNFTVTVTTPQVAGEHTIRILVPQAYYTDTTRRYPVFYFLHGAGDNPARPSLAYPALQATQQMITVIPDGGIRGWYNDWVRQNTAAGAQNWKTFHLEQVIPFIDANFRTIATKAGRAIGGLSMGGFGALHYAHARPDLFSQTVSLSGAIDLNLFWVRAAVRGTLSNVGFVFSGAEPDGASAGSFFGPAVPTDSVFGSLDELGDRSQSLTYSPVANASDFQNVGVTLYNGAGNGNLLDYDGFSESVTKSAQNNMTAALTNLGIPYRAVNYGNGANWGTNCQGKHTYGCWAQDLVDYIPRLEQSFANAS